jgi:tetratricopeptide (TPR) repeat protein
MQSFNFLVALTWFVTFNAIGQIHSEQDSAQESTRLFYLAQEKMTSNDFKDALESLNKSLKLNPRNSYSINLKGQALIFSDHSDSAIVFLNNQIQQRKSDYFTGYVRGIAYYKSSLWRKAIPDLTKFIDTMKYNSSEPVVRAHSMRGECYHNIGDYEKSIKDLSFLIDISPVFYERLATRSLEYYNIKKFQLALKDIELYISLFSYTDKEILDKIKLRVEILLELGIKENKVYADSAITTANKYLKKDSTDVTFNWGLISGCAIKGDSVNSGMALKGALRRTSNKGLYYMRIGILTMRLTNNCKKALNYYSLAFNENPKPDANFYWCLGNAKKCLGDTLGAKVAYHKAIICDSSYVDAYHSRLNLLTSKVGTSRIVDSLVYHDITQLINLSIGDSVMVSQYLSFRAAVALKFRSKNSAMQDINEAISLSKRSAFPYLVRAILLMDESNVKVRQGITSDLDRALELDDKMWQLYVIKAYNLYELNGKSTEGCNCLKKADKLGGVIPKGLRQVVCKGKPLKKPIDFSVFMYARDYYPK